MFLHRSRSRILLVATLAFFAAGAVVVIAADEPTLSPFGDAKASARPERVQPKAPPIESILREATSMDFTERELAEVVDYLEAQHDIQIQFDMRALEEAGIMRDTLVTVNVKNVNLRYALERVLQPLDADFLVRENGTLMITSQQEANSFTETVVYPVGDLAEGSKDTRSGLDDLTKLLQTTVEAASWSVAGGHGAVAAVPSRGALVITHNQRTHAKIRNLLDSLRSLPKVEKVAEAKPARASDRAPIVASSIEVKIYDLQRAVANKEGAVAHPFAQRLDNEAQTLAQRLPHIIGSEKWNISNPDLTAIAIGSKVIVRQTPDVQREVASIIEAFAK